MDMAPPPGSDIRIYLVGGAVRDELLGHPVEERDFVVVGATPGDLVARGFTQVGRDFPVFLHPETKQEYALARTERKTGPGYRGFVVHSDTDVTLEQDLRRRDLTINALARDEAGNLIDYHGGRSDLEQRVLRHISEAFVEDPVRILRVARFGARFADLGFEVADETMALMRNMVGAGEVDALVPERVWQELTKALAAPKPSRFFEILRECGALERLFPEVERLYGVPQPAKWHPEIDTGVHTMMVLDMAARLSPEPEVAFAALTHDLGKGTTPREILPRHKGHEERSVDLIEGLCERLRVPRRYRELARVAARYHGLAHKAGELRPGTLLELFQGADAFRRPGRFEQVLIAFEADYRGRAGYQERDYPQADYLRRLLAAVRAVDVGVIAAASRTKDKIPELIRNARLRALRAAIRERSG